MKRLLSALVVVLMMAGVCASSSEAAASTLEQVVIVHFDYGHKDWKPFFEFEQVLEDAINKSGAGDYDGNELAVNGSDGSLYMYGPDADRLFAVAKPILQIYGSAEKRHGDVTLRERQGQAGARSYGSVRLLKTGSSDRGPSLR